MAVLAGCSRPGADHDTGRVRQAAGDVANPGAAGYTGHDAHGIPHYATVQLNAADRDLLGRVYGIGDPSRLYVSDSTTAGVLKYDTERKRCRPCHVNSYRVGFVSLREPGETWSHLESRVAAMRPSDFPASARIEDTSTAKLDPAIRGEVEQMLADARRAGFSLRVTATYRSPEREAYLMMIGHGRTHTLTSLHSYGRAIDVAIDDGNPRHPHTRADWVRFRKWVTTYRGRDFRILGTPDVTWDWTHVEMPAAGIGFSSIDAAIARARACAKPGVTLPCDFPPNLPSTRGVLGQQTALDHKAL
jgi:hypothetical protein